MKTVRTYEFEPEERAKLDELNAVQEQIDQLERRRDALVKELVDLGVTVTAIEDETSVPKARLAKATARARTAGPLGTASTNGSPT